MRRGVRLAVDVGTVRIGLASSDPDGLLATPVETVARAGGEEHLRRILQHVDALAAVEILVGLPLALSGNETASTADARQMATTLAAMTTVPVRLVDERLTTVTAARQLRESGRQASRSRGQIDQAAAVVLLQHALDAERLSGRAAGTAVETTTADRLAPPGKDVNGDRSASS